MIFKRILINNFGGLWEKDIELTSGSKMCSMD